MKKEKRVIKDEKILRRFIGVFCRENHGSGKELCPECAELLAYALKRNEKCPLDPKPKCRDCKIHCYKAEMRRKIREVMKFSGIWHIKRGRLDWVLHYFW
ncbi:nitrous oxide-stimulated promoter family protein [Geovibrio thiophilus]|uniref:Nitrous oxide-stimulated promoter family protein n=1 Tax=Geovibrio thiophilus TaxID=139438 RepID=A0A3R5UWK7_9BACT|nr:nitrous oxide-stimulated promoter family protein [Geovibrio thiophilus]QAR34508.1 nitrous oxide-stimulated promoter family protein [Geovibrio thiophilus]